MQKIKINKHSSIQIGDIYIDPYLIENSPNDAKYIFITHGHYDHYSPEDIMKVANDNTKYIAPQDVALELLNSGISSENITAVEPSMTYKVDDLDIKTTYAYNKNHPKAKNWVGYIIKCENVSYYIAGDTDFLEENLDITCDVAFVPIGGTYTMDVRKAAEFINIIRPKKAIPMHYGVIVGSKNLGKEFLKYVESDIEVELISCY